jgi:hypothetical protein
VQCRRRKLMHSQALLLTPLQQHLQLPRQLRKDWQQQ